MFKRRKQEKKELDSEKKVDLEKNDFLAIMIAAFTTIVPVVLLLLGFIYLVLYLIFLR